MATTATHVWRPSGARRCVLDGFVPLPRGSIPTTPAPLAWPAKDPADVLDYEFDISAALLGNKGDTIVTLDATLTPNAPGDLALASMIADGAIAVFWFGQGQIGTIYVIQITITTQSGRTISRAVLLPVQALASTSAPSEILTTDTGTIVTDQNGNPILIGG
jgi:hypothetical protein